MEVVGGAILSALLRPLVQKLMSAEELLKFAPKKQMDNEFQKWQLSLLEIRAVLDDAEERQITNPVVKNWVSKLRDLAYDVEDILDEFVTENALTSMLKAESQAHKSVIWRFTPTSCFCCEPSTTILNVKTGSKLAEITKRLQEIVREKKDLELRTDVEERFNRVNERLHTTSLVKEPKVYGREKDKESILELLMSGEASDSRFSVISVTGMGGVGKTTLAQLVYNDERVKFDYKAWVCVSDDFDILRINKAILHVDSFGANDLNSLQVKLKEKLFQKKFLIVLDDVWCENYEEWTTLCSPFFVGAPGSKIIVTTRSQQVSLLMGPITAYAVKELSHDDCLSLFVQHALNAKNFDAHPNLKEIGYEIVKRCKGLPLAAKTLGGLLRGKQKHEEWEDVLNSKMWDLPEGQSSILPALKLSYHYLPSHLKQCFAYCAVFPKDYEFDKNELVLLWMAEGFLWQSKEKKQMEDLGNAYFHDLLSRSFFQQSRSNESRYIMHDLINDLAQSINGEICFNLDDKFKGVNSYAKVRHASFTRHDYDISQRFEVFYKMKSLRTFLALPMFSSSYDHLAGKVLHELVPKLKCLTVLSLAGYRLVELPSSIGALKHLRYLNLSYTKIEILPESLSQLLNLQTLKLRGCEKLMKLPVGIGNLINLQYLDISNTDSLQDMPPQIGDLTNLKTMPKFIVGKGNGLRITELIKLSYLQGKLHIIGLHNVAVIQDAMLANLKEKQGLNELALEWNDKLHGSRNERDELQVLNALRPHQNLQKLSIIAYGGTIFPPWVEDPSFTNMVYMELCKCRNVISLPSLGQLPSLRNLTIRGMNGVKKVDAEFYADGSRSIKAFPSLEVLIIEDMLEWEQWSSSNNFNEEAERTFSNLHELTIRNCPKLVGEFPNCLQSLKRLNICNCPRLENLPELLSYLCELVVEECHDVILNGVPVLSSLTSLRIRSISGVVCLHKAFLQALVALENLVIEGCSELKYLCQDGTNLDKLSCLQSLEIKNCEQLVSLFEGQEHGNLKKFQTGLNSLASLRDLKLNDCPRLVSFLESGFPYSLKHLEISQCDSLKSLPEGMMTVMNCEKRNQCFLEELLIKQCQSLKSFPTGMLPATLKLLDISGCQNLESVPEGIMYDDADENETPHLEHLTIEGLSFLPFPTGEFAASLKTLGIGYCKIQSLDSLYSLSNLTELEITGCHMLESFPEMGLCTPNLISLIICKCENLTSLPNHMDNLLCLQNLNVFQCPRLEFLTKGGLSPNLTELEIRDCEEVTQPMSDWGLHKLIYLKQLILAGTSPCTNKVSFPDDDGLLLPTSLITLYIFSLKNLKSISRGIQNLMSLKTLYIWDCPKLWCLPKKGLPATLGFLYIRLCPLLKERCSKKKGDYWRPIIAYIPCVIIE